MTSPTFADLGIGAPFDTTLARLEITTPTPVQAQAIPLLREGRDLIASAPTGTGKTAAFMLPALQRIMTTEGRPGRGPRMLVLTPTRELAQQVAKASQAFSRGMPRTTTVCVTGGESYTLQNRLLSSPHEVLVATPGRLMDQMNAGRIDLSRVEMLVLDEADRMLDMGFSDDVLAIAQALSPERQTVCFTATLSRGVRALADRLLRNPHWMEVEQPASHDEAIDQHVLYVDDFQHRNRLLEACLADTGLGQAIVFTSTKRHAEELAGQLSESGHAAQALHGDLTQRERTRALNKLRRGECRVLVATDVAARGIDVASITHVINFDLPKFAEDYVHRIGRTGRAGASGQALSFVGRDDLFALRKIEHFIGRRVQVSEIEGHEANFRPLERRAAAGKSGAFRKPGSGRPGYGKPGYGKPGYGKPAWGKPHGARPDQGWRDPAGGDTRQAGAAADGTVQAEHARPARDAGAPAQPGFARSGFTKPGYVKRESPKPDFSSQEPRTPRYAKPEYSKPEYAKPGYSKPGYAKPGYAKPGYAKAGHGGPGYAKPGYAKAGPARQGATPTDGVGTTLHAPRRSGDPSFRGGPAPRARAPQRPGGFHQSRGAKR
jgi:superfamily II DNA/RNA helicase